MFLIFLGVLIVVYTLKVRLKLRLKFEVKVKIYLVRVLARNFGKMTSWFELSYHDSGHAIYFSFFTMQFFQPCQKIAIPNRNIKKEK